MSISAGALSSFIIDREGKVWATGANYSGQLGLGDREQRDYFILIEDLPPIVMVSAGVEHTLFLDQDGHVWATGNNNNGQLGLGEPSPNSPDTASGVRGGLSEPPVIVSDIQEGLSESSAQEPRPRSIYSSNSGRGSLLPIFIRGNVSRTRPEMIPNLNFIVSIAAGEKNSLFLDNQGRVWESGGGLTNSNYPVQLNVPYITAIASGPKNSVLIDLEGGVWISNLSSSIVLDEAGNVSFLGEYKRIPDIPPMKAVSVGTIHILLLDQEGRIWSRGLNNYGQVGRVTDKGWRHDYKDFEPVILNSKIVKISAGDVHSLALDENGHLWVFGSNNEGELGLTGMRPRVIPEEHPLINTFDVALVDISAGSYHSLALDREGKLLVFGQGSEGQLGLNYLENVFTPTLIQNIRGRVLGEPLDPEMLNPFIITEYDIIDYLRNHDLIADFSIRNHVDGDTIMEFVDTNGQQYISRVKYDPQKDKFEEPIQPQYYYNFFVALGNTDQLLDYYERDDIPLSDPENRAIKALEFISKLGQRYLISVIHTPSNV